MESNYLRMPPDAVGWLNRLTGAALFAALVWLGLHLAKAAPAVCTGAAVAGGLLVLLLGWRLFEWGWRGFEEWLHWKS